uniref:Uncharacterized protein n=1 Tax=Ananas comosus var. bracteatus TaxID=296719 RepID=A0A6V7Q9W1_ANACO|nr:unnamed protein product [Ananas comosus var. bracteatus]
MSWPMHLVENRGKIWLRQLRPNRYCKKMQRLGLEVVEPGVPATLAALVVQPTLLERIKELQASDEYLQKVRGEVESGSADDFNIGADGILRFRNRWCVPKNKDIRKAIMQEAHQSPYSIVIP